MKNKIAFYLRLIIGLFFIVSAVLKVFSMDEFEIYVYSFNVVNLNSSFILSRLLVVFETLLGVFLIVGWQIKLVSRLSILMMLGFCGFLVYLILGGTEEHCHCMGDLVEMSHGVSLLKNVVLIVALFLICKFSTIQYQLRNWVIVSLSIFTLLFPFLVSPPDSFKFLHLIEEATYNEENLNAFLVDHDALNQKQIICFYGVSCEFCKKAAKKIDVIIRKSENEGYFYNVFWGSEEEVSNFHKETYTKNINHEILDPMKFLKITNGEMPVILLLEKGKVRSVYNYRTIDENEILNFLK